MKLYIDADMALKVFEDGHVEFPNGRMTKGCPTKAGYMRVQFNKKMKYVHRLVAELFIDNPKNLPQVNHKDMDPSNNNVSNLEWVSNGQNVKHSYENNKVRKKIICGNSRKPKLTKEQVLWVINNPQHLSKRAMARTLDVDFNTVQYILLGKTHTQWTELDAHKEGA